MLGEESESHYEVVFKDGEYLISGKSKSDGEKISFENLHFSEKTAKEIVFILNKNKVSLCHAKDVIRDFIMEKFEEIMAL